MTDAIGSSRLDASGAVRALFGDPDWMFKTGVGGTINALAIVVLMLLGPLSAPAIVAMSALVIGYALRVAKARALGEVDRLPRWENWPELFISGLSWLAIQFALYFAFISVVALVAVFGVTSGAVKLYSGEFITWAVTSVLLVTIFWVFTSFLARFLMIGFAVEEKMTAGFAAGEVLRRARANPRDFICAWLLAVGIQWAAVVLPVLTVVGVFFLPSTIFVGELLAATFAAQVWGKGA